jgi:hypothetical protein
VQIGAVEALVEGSRPSRRAASTRAGRRQPRTRRRRRSGAGP